MSNNRTINQVITVPPVGPGFAGPHHFVAPVIQPGSFDVTNPFFLMMDDRINVAGEFGGEHPHAGLETVTFMLEGSVEDLGGKMQEGDVEWMTAGRGIIHAEHAVASEAMRLLQLWVVLPESQRNISPRVQLLSRDLMPVRREAGVEARVYSGRSGNVESATTNAVPVTLLDIRLDAGASFEQELPSSYNGFAFVLDGAVTAGLPPTSIVGGQVGWLHPTGRTGTSSLILRADNSSSRVLLYAGEPQNMALAARGPFIAGSEPELAELFARYRGGEFERASQLRQR